jgi:hypothetical protein
VLDKRQHPRFACDLAAALLIGNRRLAARTQDLSRGGMCLSIGEPLSVGVEVEISLRLVFSAHSCSEPLSVAARVVWCTPLGDEHQLGCKFKTLTADQLQYIDLFLRFLRGDVLEADDDDEVAADPSDPQRDPDSEPFA